ncbi:MAG: MFS transporter, partial [Chloroflexota bacterium]
MQAQPTMPTTTAEQKLPFKTKFFYGMGDMATASVSGVIGFLINPFLLNVAGLTAPMVGIILLIKQIWDAINDPFMGSLSDRTESRFGRRKVWILGATVPLAVLFFLHWQVPNFSQWGLFAYYLVVSILLDMFYTMHNVPYASLTAEMTDDYSERSRINIYRFVFSITGALIATIIFALLTDGAADPQGAYF